VGMQYHYFYNASLDFDSGQKPILVCGIISTHDKSNVFDLDNVKNYIGARHGTNGRCDIVHSLSYLGESEGDYGA